MKELIKLKSKKRLALFLFLFLCFDKKVSTFQVVCFFSGLFQVLILFVRKV